MLNINRSADVIALAAGVFLIYLAFMPPRIYSIDGVSMYEVAVSVVTRGTFEVSPEIVTKVAAQGRGGHFYSMCWPLLSILSLAPVSIAFAAARHLPIDPNRTGEIAVLFFSPLFTALSVAMVAMVAMRLGARPRAAIVAALCFGFGTIAMVYIRDFFAEPLLTLVTLLGLYWQLAPDGDGWASGAVAGIAVLAKPPGIVLGPLFALYAAAGRRRIGAIVFPLLGAAAGLGLYFVYNQVRFASALTFGQPHSFSLRYLPSGIAGLLVSPSRGVIWYSPPVLALLGLRWRVLKRLEVLLILAIAAAYLAIYSAWDSWGGGWCWGPRLLLPALAILIVLGSLLDQGWQRAMLVLAAVGFVINSPTLVSSYFNIYRQQIAAGVEPYRLLWSPLKAPLLEVWRTASQELGRAPALTATVLPAYASDGSLPFVEGIWWWRLCALGIPPWVGMVISVILVATGVGLIVRAFRHTREFDESLSSPGRR